MVVLAAAWMALAAGDPAAATKAAKPKPYPLETCVVSGEKLGSMGKPYVFTHEGREIKMCCKGCLKAFNKNTAKYIKQLEEAEKKPKAK
jgi:hypothetical protein